MVPQIDQIGRGRSESGVRSNRPFLPFWLCSLTALCTICVIELLDSSLQFSQASVIVQLESVRESNEKAYCRRLNKGIVFTIRALKIHIPCSKHKRLKGSLILTDNSKREQMRRENNLLKQHTDTTLRDGDRHQFDRRHFQEAENFVFCMVHYYRKYTVVFS